MSRRFLVMGSLVKSEHSLGTGVSYQLLPTQLLFVTNNVYSLSRLITYNTNLLINSFGIDALLLEIIVRVRGGFGRSRLELVPKTFLAKSESFSFGL